MNQERINSVLLGITPIVLFIALWQSLISFGFAPTSLLPPPGAVFGKLAKDFFNGDFLHDIAATLIRLFAGFGIAVVVGVFIGLAAAVSPAVNAVVKPLVRVLAPIPKIALYPALLLILGFDHALEDHAGDRRRAVPDPAVDLLRRVDGRAEADLVGDGRGYAALADPVQGRAAGRNAVDPRPAAASAS